MTRKPTLLAGFRGFTLIWVGQLISLLGTGTTRFALTIWAYQETQSATALAMVALFAFAPSIVFNPVAGALVDRWNRKLVLMLSDLGAGTATIFLLIMYSSGGLRLWHLFVAGAIASLFESFQFPAFSAATTLMLDKKEYGRASGMLTTAESASQIVAPLLGGFLLTTFGLGDIMALDIISFVWALFAIALVAIPQPPPHSAEEDAGNFWDDILFGFRYIFARPSLLGMQTAFSTFNLLGSFTYILLAPFILARTDNNEMILGVVQSAGGIGALVGGILMSVWGGPKRLAHGVFLGMAFSALLGTVPLGTGQNGAVWAIATFTAFLTIPVMNGSNQAIWQRKVPAQLQGRVFAVRRFLAQISYPVALVAAGPLADRLFEPALQPNGRLTPIFGWLVGTGNGAGMGLILVISGILTAVAALACYAFPTVRDIEEILPDSDAVIVDS